MADNGSGSSEKPEWKRYKQFTKNDLCSALQAIRGGMSTLEAARTHGVPSRTLYSKAKGLGLVRGRLERSSAETDSNVSDNRNEIFLEEEVSSDKIDSTPGMSQTPPIRGPRNDDLQITLEDLHIGESSPPKENNSKSDIGIAGNSSGSSEMTGWVRYKDHTENDMHEAIEAIRKGMSLLEAARKYGVPSRTLQDEAKLLGV